jgi:hypothetical protein
MTIIRKPENDDLRRQVRSLAAANDIEHLAQLPRDQLEVRRAEAMERLEARQDRVYEQGRDLSDREDTLSKADMAEVEALDVAMFTQEREAAKTEHEARNRAVIANLTDTRRRNRHPSLLLSDATIRKHAEAMRLGGTYAAEEVESRAVVTVASDYGSPGSYDIPGLLQATPLRAFAGVPSGKLTGATSQMPSLTLPVGTAGVAESTVSAEYDTVNVANLTALRYGRWTKVTSFVNEFDQLRAINTAHAIAIARDLNLVDITAIQTAAGSVTAFSAGNLDLNVRAAILKVCGVTLCEPEDVVLFGTSAALAVVNGFTPASGADRGSVSTRVYGARTYVTEDAVAGNVYAFYPGAFQVFQTGMMSASQIGPTDGSNTFGSWLTSTAPGVFIVGGAAGVDVVTP